MFPLAILPAITGLVKSGYGMIQEGKQRRAYDKTLGQMNAENKAMYNRDYYSDYTQTQEAQNVIRQMRDAFKQQSKQADSSQAVTGATVEAAAARKEAQNKAMSNLMGNLGARGTQLKEKAKDRYLRNKSTYDAMKLDELSRQAQGANNLLYSGLNDMGGTDWASILTGAKYASMPNVMSGGVKPINVSQIKDVSGIKITNPLK